MSQYLFVMGALMGGVHFGKHKLNSDAKQRGHGADAYADVISD